MLNLKNSVYLKQNVNYHAIRIFINVMTLTLRRIQH